MGNLLAYISLCEASLCVAFLVQMDLERDWEWEWYTLLCCLLLEPVVYYLFSGYIAMRAVDTVAELTRMFFTIPLYYLAILACAIGKKDLRRARKLSELIYFDFPGEILSYQLGLHVLGSVPFLAVVCLVWWERETPLGLATLAGCGLSLVGHIAALVKIRISGPATYLVG